MDLFIDLDNDTEHAWGIVRPVRRTLERNSVELVKSVQHVNGLVIDEPDYIITRPFESISLIVIQVKLGDIDVIRVGA